MDRETRKRLYQLCDPEEALGPDDERNVDLDVLGVRGDSWTAGFAQRLARSNRPICELLSAPVGAGITTELHRLSGTLRSGGGPFAVRVDAAVLFDLRDTVDVADLLVVLVAQVEDAVARETKRSPSEKPLRRIWEWLADLGEARPSSIERALHDLSSSPVRRARLRARVDASRSRFLGWVQDELILLDHEARKAGLNGLVVLVDGLERLSGSSADWRPVLDSAERAFAPGSPLLSLPVHVVWTLPFAILPRMASGISTLPMIGLSGQDGGPSPTGFEAARLLLERRLSPVALDELLGTVPGQTGLHTVIAASGGSPRGLVELAREVVAAGPLEGARLTRTITLAFEAIGRGISETGAEWLTRVHAHKRLVLDAPTDQRVAEAMLLRGAVLPYRSGADAWFDVHPAALRSPAIVAALARA